MKTKILKTTRSVCPICLLPLPAQIEEQGTDILLKRTCPEHGPYAEAIWRGKPSFQNWKRPKKKDALFSRQTENSRGCPYDCGRCPAHAQQACAVLFEITTACNLHCPVCFASPPSNNAQKIAGAQNIFPPLALLKEQLQWIHTHASSAVLQLSGGEPTLHPDLVGLCRTAAQLFPAVQLNTNGILLAQDKDLPKRLADAGLSWVFLQFDGTNDTIYTILRGQALLQTKMTSIENCLAADLGVVLVATVAAGVNDHNLGELLRFALAHAPGVRGIHMQIMTRSGRNAFAKQSRLTLPEVLQAICTQSKGAILPEHAFPPGCEHERCSFHCRYTVTSDKKLHPLRQQACCSSAGGSPLKPDKEQNGPHESAAAGATRAINSIIRCWSGSSVQALTPPQDPFERFIAQMRAQTFSVTCMDFQDAGTLDLERLQGCCIQVYQPPGKLIPFCAMNLSAQNGAMLYRSLE